MNAFDAIFNTSDAFEIDLLELNIPHIHLENITDQIDDALF